MSTVSVDEAGAGASSHEVPHHQMLIGGEWRDAISGERLESVNPATEAVIATFPHAGAEDVVAAVVAAEAGFREWRRWSADKRAGALRALAARMAEQAEAIARLDAIDSGLPIATMRADARRSSTRTLHFAGLASELKGSTFETPEDVTCYTVREPFGVVGRIVPFNHPFMFAAKIASALAAGNAVVLKPAETTTLSAIELGRMTLGLLPPGVVNVITGLGRTTGRALVQHPAIRRISFTGGTEGGRAVLREAAEHLKRVTLELGGKNPMIVFADVDLDKAATACVRANHLHRTMGQSCQATSRVFVHESIHDRFLEALAAKLSALRVGDPLSDETEIGPMNSRAHYERVLGFIESGNREGARLVIGGRQLTGRRGYYIEPTLFADVADEMTIGRAEIFGPVVCVSRWRDFDEVVRRANATPYGLTANIWTNQLALATRAARAVEAGYVWINGAGQRVEAAPYGGFKMSGLGKEGDLSELLSFTEEKCIETHLV